MEIEKVKKVRQIIADVLFLSIEEIGEDASTQNPRDIVAGLATLLKWSNSIDCLVASTSWIT